MTRWGSGGLQQNCCSVSEPPDILSMTCETAFSSIKHSVGPKAGPGRGPRLDSLRPCLYDSSEAIWKRGTDNTRQRQSALLRDPKRGPLKTKKTSSFLRTSVLWGEEVVKWHNLLKIMDGSVTITLKCKCHWRSIFFLST